MEAPFIVQVDTSRFRAVHGFEPSRTSRRIDSASPGRGWTFEDVDGVEVASFDGMLATCQHAAAMVAKDRGIATIYVRP